MTINEIKEATKKTAPYFFSPASMRFFGQTMRSFKVHKQDDGRYLIQAPMTDKTTGQHMGWTKRFFNPQTNNLDHE